MPFDTSTAEPAGFDLASALPVLPQGVVDWANGVQDRLLHPDVALKQIVHDYASQTPQQLAQGAGNFLGHGVSGVIGATAWHGSPHLFDKFKSEAIGTGEGAQAYGHGLYLAEHPEVATGYQKNLSDAVNEFKIQDNAKKLAIDSNINPTLENYGSDVTKSRLPIIANRLIGNNTSIADELANLKVKSAAASNPKPYQKDIQAITEGGNDFAEALNAARKTFNDHVENYQGYLYKTDIPDAHIDKMLDWDKPLSEQSARVQNAVEGSGHDWQGGDFDSGEAFYKGLAKQYGGQVEASKILDAWGIPGIKYLDGSSRADGVGTSNFVMFNPDDIRILERNGQPTGQVPFDINSAVPQ